MYLYSANTASVDIPVTNNEGIAASAAAANATTTSSATASSMAASSAVPRRLSSEIYSSPQSVALKCLVSLQVFTLSSFLVFSDQR